MTWTWRTWAYAIVGGTIGGAVGGLLGYALMEWLA